MRRCPTQMLWAGVMAWTLGMANEARQAVHAAPAEDRARRRLRRMVDNADR